MSARDPEMQALVDEAKRQSADDAERVRRKKKYVEEELPPVAKRYDVYRELDRDNDLGPLWWVGFVSCFIVFGASNYNRWAG